MRVHTPGGNCRYDCDFETNPHCWRQRPVVPAERAAAREKAVRDVLLAMELQIRAGEASEAGLWGRVRTEAALRVPLAGNVGQAYVAHVHAGQ